MIYVGIDVAKNKHDCCILGMDGEYLCRPFSFDNDSAGFGRLMDAILECSKHSVSPDGVRAGFEATGHYSENLAAFLRSNGFEPVVFNPLRVKLHRQASSLRKTKTDRADAKCIAELLLLDHSNPAPISYQISELKSLTRHRSRLVEARGKCKVHLNRLVDVLFPELQSVVSTLTQASVLALLAELPGAAHIALCRIDRLTNLLRMASKGRYKRDKAVSIKALAKDSIGRSSPARSLELQQVIEQIYFFNSQIEAVEKQIACIVSAMDSPLLTIPGIGIIIASVTIAEIGDIRRFDTPDQLLAFAGLEPSTYQSGKFKADRTPMVKHGSTYLRWAVMQAARLTCVHCPDFRRYMERKLAQGKHYFVALGHLSKKLIRVIFHILNANEPFVPTMA